MVLFFFLSCIGVVPEVQCAVKRKEKKAQREKDKPNSTTDVSPEVIKTEPLEMKVIITPTKTMCRHLPFIHSLSYQWRNQWVDLGSRSPLRASYSVKSCTKCRINVKYLIRKSF